MTAEKTRRASARKVRAPRGPRRKRSKLTPALQRMVLRYLPLARKLSKSSKAAWPQYAQEFDASAYLALVEAAESFRPEHNVNFATWARIRIKGELHDIHRKIKQRCWKKKLPNARRSFFYVPGFHEACSRMLTSPDQPVGRDVEVDDRISTWLSLLPPRHAHICRELYLEHRSQTDIAAEIGLARSRICVIHAEALQLLRELSAVQEAALDMGLDVARN